LFVVAIFSLTLRRMAFKGVLFDWRGTLFHDFDNVEWLQVAARSIGRSLPTVELERLSRAIDEAAKKPHIAASLLRHDADAVLHRQVELAMFREAGLDEELAVAVYETDGTLEVSLPYPDTVPVLRRLKELGVRIAILSDINFELRPFFELHGIDDCVDGYALSYEYGWVKPDIEAFEMGLELLGLPASEVLMVGDNPRRDIGGVALGITTLILPPVANYSVRGLDAVLRLVERD
jgi:FMN phosphatase YigB (HAD superfamily)